MFQTTNQYTCVCRGLGWKITIYHSSKINNEQT